MAFQLLAGRGSSTASASGNGAYFDHIVFIAMENAAYASVFGSGTVSSCPSSTDPFLCSMLPLGSTVPNLNNYGATAADANDFSGCSAACYVGLLAGYTYGVKDGYGDLTAANLVADRFAPAGLTWQAYCESGCPRGNDHFPFTSFADTRASANVFASSSVSTSTFSAAANSTNPPNFLWYTPTDNHNMHDNSISTGDSYLKSFLVGSGSLTNPASGSLLASNLFTNTNYRTLLYLWWDECGGSNGSCNSNNAAPNLLYGTPVKKGYVSPDTTGIDEYASLRTIANNWGFSPIAQGDVAAANSGYMFNDVFGSSSPLPLSTSFTFSPGTPAVGTVVAFTATSVGGNLPYSYSWNFGDGSTGSGAVAGHSYSSAGLYSVTTTVTDSTGKIATSSRSVTVSQPSALTASFAYAPSVPVSGQSISFTGSASGGTSPYSYSWSLAGTSKTGNPVSQSFTNGTYTISLTVTDTAGKTTTISQSLTVLPPSTSSGSVPTLIGWGGVKMDESVAGSGGTASAVFLGEYASNMELLLFKLEAQGYNTVRVDFDPYCTDTIDYNYMSVYSATNAQRAIQIAQHYGFWIIIDYHGYSDIFRDTSCWLNYWKPIVQNIGPLYSNIIWEPENEPEYYNCIGSPSSCPASPVSSDSAAVTYLSSAYQQWIDQARLLGDTHWIVVQNLCSYSCNLCPGGDGSCSAAIDSYPSVTDSLGTPSHGGKIFISLHSYMDYNYYSNSTGWNNATADSVAQGYYQTVVAGVASTGWPALNTEGGTDPLCYPCTTNPPDMILPGSAGYTTTSLHFIQTLVNLYDNSPQRINWVWWPAGDWTNTTSSIYGAMDCASNPEGWGCLLKTVPVTGGTPPVLSTSFIFTPNAPVVSETVKFVASASGEAGPYTFGWVFGDGSAGSGSSVTHAYPSAGTYIVVLTVKDNGSPQQIATSEQTVSVSNPLPTSTVSFSYSPSSPEEGQQVAFTASASGGTAPYSFSWSFGDGSSSSSNPATHMYSLLGSTTVSLNVTDASGLKASSSQSVSIASAPAVMYSLSPTSPEATSPVIFTANATGGVGTFTYSWTFGDSGTSSSNPATHTYTNSGSFTVTVTATDANGGKETSSQTINVAISLAVTFTHSPSSSIVNQPATFTATVSGGVGTAKFSWNFGDGASSTADSTTHAYTTPGSFRVNVTATDSDGVGATSSQTITVIAPLSTSFSYSPPSPQLGQQVIFTASASSGSTPYSFNWSFGDGSTGVGSSVTHAYSSVGDFTAVLTVNDSGVPNQTASSQRTVTVSPLQLAASFTYSPSLPQAGQQITFAALGSGGTAPYSFFWTFGDSSNATGSTAAHTYSSTGNFSVTLTIKDSGSPQQTATSSTAMDVSPTPTSTAVACPGTGIVGVSLVCGVTVVDTASGIISVPTGFVSVNSSIGCFISSGSCTVNITSTVSGSLEVSASYGGDAGHLPSISPPVLVRINSRETSTVVTCARSTPTVGEDTTCSATVTDMSPGMTNTLAGNLTFTPVGVCVLTGTGASASCSTNIATTAVGTLSISATYLGDSNHNASSGIATIIVFPLPPPPLVADLAFSPNSPVTGQTVNFTATVTGGSPPYTYSWSFGDGTTDSGNPASHTYENANTYSVVLIVTDANGTTFSDTKLLAVKVTPNPPITLTVPSNQSIDHGSNLRFNVTAVEDSPQQISMSCLSCPSLGADFTSNSGPGAAYGTFSWTPTEAQAPGVYFVVLSSTDGSQIVNATVAITVNEDNTPPTLHVPGTLTVRDGETLQFVVNATDSIAPPENLTLTATGLPDGASFDPVTGVFYWPIQGVQPGPYTLTFTATDSGTPPLQDSQTVVVHVNNGNGRCFICEVFLESQLAVNPSPLVPILREMVALMGFLGVIPMKYLKDHGRERFKHTVQHSGHVENAS